MKILEYLTDNDKSPFSAWFSKLDSTASLKVNVALTRLEHGNTSNVKAVGAGVHEYRINYGPGYRIYYAYDGETLVILLGGGTKKRQQADIDAAKERWNNYKKRKQ